VIQRVRIANPDNYDELRADLEKTLEEQLEKMGAQAEKVQQEAEKALVQAQERVDAIAQKKLDDEKKAEEEAQQKKEEIEKVDRLTAEAEAEVVEAEGKVEEGIESVKIDENESTPESILEAVKKTGEVSSEMQGVLSEVSKSLSEKRTEMGDTQLALAKLKELFGPLFRKVAVCRRKVDGMKASAKTSKDLANRKSKAIKKEKDIKDLFNKFDKDKDGKLKRAEVAAYSKGKFEFELQAPVLDKILRQLGDTGVPFAKFSRLKGMVAIARSEVNIRIKRAEAAEKERLKKEAEAKRQEELAAKKAEIEKAFSDAVEALKSAEASSRKAEGISSKFDDAVGNDDMPAAELTEAANNSRDSATEGRGQIADAKEKLEKVVDNECEDDELKIWKASQEASLKRRIAQVESQLERVDIAVKGAEEKAARKAYTEMEALKTETVTALRLVMTNDGIKGDELFERIGGEKSTEIDSEKFAKFVRSLPAPTFKDEQAEGLFAHVTEGEDKLSKEKFSELIRLFYKVSKASVLTAEVTIKSKTLRRLDLGEVVEALDAPKKDDDIGVTRMRCKAVTDGLEGFVTISGNQGTVFLEPGGNTYKCIKDTYITADLSVAEGKNVRKIRVGEVVDILEFETKDESCNVKRIKVKAKTDGATGWVTVAGNQGTAFMEPC